ncbi:MAG TPA: hypothetical protein VNP04_20115 [Alphaproteobacteria bacterium]|nr:hypothetical protein [Alphaproteobacteria bacterium]
MRDPQIRRSTPESPPDHAQRPRSDASDFQAASPEMRPRRVGIYDRFRRSVGLPRTMTLGIAIAIVGFILILLMMWIR